jgi:THO complex subunit 4
VVFARKQDALKAVTRYDGVALDGKPMKIEMLGTNLPNRVPIAARTVA